MRLVGAVVTGRCVAVAVVLAVSAATAAACGLPTPPAPGAATAPGTIALPTDPVFATPASTYPPAAELPPAAAPAMTASPAVPMPVAAPPPTTAAPTTNSPAPAAAAPTTAGPPSTPPPMQSPPPSTVAPPPPGGRGVPAAFTGDILVHSPLWDQAARNGGGAGLDFRPMLSELQPLLDATDLAVCHLETPLAPAGEAPSTSPIYGVPVEIVAAIAAAGYERCSTASNHTLDRGVAGIDRTVETLTAAGLGESGMARTPAEIEPQVVDVNGVRVSHLAYSYGFNGIPLPAGQEWRSALIEPARIVADAREARRRGAEVVIVSLHWGAEKRREVTADQRSVAEAITASGAVDLVVGHHAHVLQPIEQVNGRWVVFGLGNILSNLPGPGWPAESEDGAVVTAAITIGPDGAVAVAQPVVHPTWVDREHGWIVRPVREELADPVTPAERRPELEASLARTMAALGPFVAAPAQMVQL